VHTCEPSKNPDQPNMWDRYLTPGECYSPIGDLGSGCVSLLFGWAVGVGNVTLPAEAGHRIGTATSHSTRHVILEIHYDNPTREVDMVDSSGIMVHYTSTMRQYDAGTLTLGDVVTSFSSIPAQQPYTEYESNCPTECTSKWPHDITMFFFISAHASDW